MKSKALCIVMASIVNIEFYSYEDNVKILFSTTIASPVFLMLDLNPSVVYFVMHVNIKI